MSQFTSPFATEKDRNRIRVTTVTMAIEYSNYASNLAAHYGWRILASCRNARFFRFVLEHPAEADLHEAFSTCGGHSGLVPMSLADPAAL